MNNTIHFRKSGEKRQKNCSACGNLEKNRSYHLFYLGWSKSDYILLFSTYKNITLYLFHHSIARNKSFAILKTDAKMKLQFQFSFVCRKHHKYQAESISVRNNTIKIKVKKHIGGISIEISDFETS